MDKKYVFLAALGIALAGCASTGAQNEKPSSSSASQAASAPVAAPEIPLSTPSASAKRLVLNMTGPAIVTQAKDWPAFQKEWRDTFADHAKEAGMAFEVQEGEARPTGDAGTLLRVYVNDYRMVGIGSRIFFGVMTGNAYIDANASYTDLSDGKEFGERVYNTTSSAWGGVFAKMTPQQVDTIATKVFGEMTAAK